MATIVLIHGFFHGGWRWQEVRLGLRAAGHEVYSPTLTGLGERSHLASPEISLDTHIQDLLNVLEYEDLREAVLVGNSYGGTLAHLIAGGDGWRIPPSPGMAPRSVAQPLKPAQQPVRLTRNGASAIPTVYVHCTVKPEVDICGPSVRQARAWGWPVLDLAAGHVPAGSAPRELVDLLLRIIDGTS